MDQMTNQHARLVFNPSGEVGSGCTEKLNAHIAGGGIDG